MQVRTFHGPTLDDAMRAAQAACGTDAVVLHQTARPWWRMWQPRWTVTVAIDDPRPFRDLVAPPTDAPPPTVTLAAEDRALLAQVLAALPRQDPSSTETVAWPDTFRLIPPTGRQRIALIGPTGAGKTTTIGKLAAWSVLRDRQPTRLATMDTFRAGAVAQLQQFARVLQVPCTVIAAGDPMPTWRDGATGRIFLDTPGVTAHEPYRLAEIQARLKAFRPTVTYVVLPATDTPERLRALAAMFGALVDDPVLLLTKVDEVTSLAPIAGVMHELGWPWSYLGTGQTVPDDLVEATPDRVRDWGVAVSEVGA